VRDLYIANKHNQAFMNARLGLGQDQIQPFKASISRSISPDLTPRRATNLKPNGVGNPTEPSAPQSNLTPSGPF
jgi:hypothetical protein